MLAVQWSHSQRPTPQAARRAPWLPARVVTELTRAEGTSRGRDVKCVCEFSRGSAAARPRPPRAAHRPAAARLDAGVAGGGDASWRTERARTYHKARGDTAETDPL